MSDSCIINPESGRPVRVVNKKYLKYMDDNYKMSNKVIVIDEKKYTIKNKSNNKNKTD